MCDVARALQESESRREMGAMQGRPVVCISHYRVCEPVGKAGRVACARNGMPVVRNPNFVGDESGRVADGIGRIVDPDLGLGNISVYWEDIGDRTLWTRAAHHGTDVVVSCTDRGRPQKRS